MTCGLGFETTPHQWSSRPFGKQTSSWRHVLPVPHPAALERPAWSALPAERRHRPPMPLPPARPKQQSRASQQNQAKPSEAKRRAKPRQGTTSCVAAPRCVSTGMVAVSVPRGSSWGTSAGLCQTHSRLHRASPFNEDAGVVSKVLPQGPFTLL